MMVTGTRRMKELRHDKGITPSVRGIPKTKEPSPCLQGNSAATYSANSESAQANHERV